VVKADPKRAADFDRYGFNYDKAACDASAAHCRNLGFDYDHGAGVAMDQVKARELYKKACDAAELAACINLGDLMQAGKGGTKDVAAAKGLFEKACKGGLNDACKRVK
jgi:hypothetical protein